METKITNTTPSAEAKTPATTVTNTTVPTTALAPEQIAKATSPVSAATTTTMAPASGTTAATPASTPAADSTAATLPEGYLSGGYFHGEGKCRYTDPALVDQAAQIGKALAASNTPPTAINKMVKTLKTAARLPYPAQQGALKKLTPQVLDLEHKKKAPRYCVR